MFKVIEVASGVVLADGTDTRATIGVLTRIEREHLCRMDRGVAHPLPTRGAR